MALVYAEVTGIAGLKENLALLDAAMVQKTMIEVARAGAEPILQEARNLAPRDTGALVRDIQIIERRTANQREGLVSVGPVRTAWRAKFIERGTDAHVIRVRRKKVLADRARNTFFGKVVRHRGITAQPFLRPALERNRARAYEIMKSEILNTIQKIIR